tara:strand:- start:2768 stop:3391 length:624 start_codon:yes stop_codon:yes gene_type:complete
VAKFVKGQIPWNKGIPCSDEAKAKISINRKGKKHTPEMQERLNINLKAGAATRFSKGQVPHNKGKKNPRFTPEELKEHQKAWREKNKEKIYANTQKWRLANKDKQKEYVKKSRINNSARVNANVNKRRADKLNRTPKWLTKDDLWLIKQAYELSVLRTKLFGFKWHVDHIIPLKGKTVSGLHVPNNLQVIEGKLNIMKNNKFEGELS